MMTERTRGSSPGSTTRSASGAAVQNLNLMCGLPETAGLRLTLA